jgi:hypothetical protein
MVSSNGPIYTGTSYVMRPLKIIPFGPCGQHVNYHNLRVPRFDNDAMPLNKFSSAIVKYRDPFGPYFNYHNLRFNNGAMPLNKLFSAIVKYRYSFGFGILLLSNPLAMIGLGPLGPIAGKLLLRLSRTGGQYVGIGSIAATWQSSIGAAVSSGSPFATLQSLGMVWGTTITTAGVTITVATAAVVATTIIRERKEEWPVNQWSHEKSCARDLRLAYMRLRARYFLG